MTHGSFFTGLGGFDLAAEQLGWETLFACEKNTHLRKLLVNNFPKTAVIYDDILGNDYSGWNGKIDVLSGGFPCTQTSVSAAIHGCRSGLEGVDSSLWFAYLNAIDAIHPTWAVVENVAGVKKWGPVIQEGLEDLGYTISRLDLQADYFGLPHTRRRHIFVANAYGQRLEITRKTRSPTIEWVQGLAAAGGSWLAGAPGVVGSFNGIPNRMERVKALGNAIPPPMAKHVFELINISNKKTTFL